MLDVSRMAKECNERWSMRRGRRKGGEVGDVVVGAVMLCMEVVTKWSRENREERRAMR